MKHNESEEEFYKRKNEMLKKDVKKMNENEYSWFYFNGIRYSKKGAGMKSLFHCL